MRELQWAATERVILWLHAWSAAKDDHQRRLHERRLDAERRLVWKHRHKHLLYQRKAYRKAIQLSILVFCLFVF